MILYLKRLHRSTTKKIKIVTPLVLVVALSIPFGIWARKIHLAAQDLPQDPAFRIVESCEEPKMEIFRDHIVKDHTIVPCD